MGCAFFRPGQTLQINFHPAMGRDLHLLTDTLGRIELDAMPLTVIKTQRMTFKPVAACDRRDRRTIQPAGQKHHCGLFSLGAYDRLLRLVAASLMR